MRVRASMPIGKITNIFGTSGMTHSGCMFAPLELQAKSKDKGKAKEDVVEREKICPVTNNEAPIRKLVEEEGNFGKKEISAKVVMKFLRIIQQSELKVIK